MTLRNHIFATGCALLLLGGAAGCSKSEALEAEVHEYTEAELRKKRLDDVFGMLVKRIGTLDREHILAYLREHTGISWEGGSFVTKISLPDGMNIEIRLGSVLVTDKGEILCRITMLDGRLVFLFDDGTSYTLTSVLIDEALLEMLSDYVTPAAQ